VNDQVNPAVAGTELPDNWHDPDDPHWRQDTSGRWWWYADPDWCGGQDVDEYVRQQRTRG
jgi:hypothetical protein